jgi:peptidoglycan pentaglycine glycine transferase (the first glycine)
MQASLSDWNKFIDLNPFAHIMQHGGWGEFKQKFGWSAFRVVQGQSGAQVLIRNLPLGFKFAYIPKGPVGENWIDLLPEIHEICKEKGAFGLKIEPDEWEPKSGLSSKIGAGFLPSNPIQPRRSIEIDLQPSEEEILNRMKQKTRYNIRLAAKKEIDVRQSKEVKIFYDLLLKTGERDQFGIHSLDYYQKAVDYLSKAHACQLFLAYYKRNPLAGIMVFLHGTRAWYFYGASNDSERERMPTYLLQWEAIRWAKKNGCCEYDLWGVPDEDEKGLEDEFTNRSDGLWGVYRFKRGFGGLLKRSVGAWDYVYSPVRYWVFLKMLRIRKMQFN